MSNKKIYISPNSKYRVVVFMLKGDIIPKCHVYVNKSKSFLSNRKLNQLPQYIKTEIDKMKYMVVSRD